MPHRFLFSVLAIVAVAALAWVFVSTRAPQPTGIEEFLASHWQEPLAPQGEPPANFSPLEASLAPEACGQCHAQQYRDWGTSLHSQAMGAGILWQFHLMSQGEANGCLRCHAPLAEQKALLARERGWSGPSSAPPAYVPSNLHQSGLVCAACHVRSHARFGPPRASRSETQPAHAGFTAHDAFSDSRFCATCHQFPETGRRVNGKLLENTYEEWRASPAAAAGKPCQSCHMPDRRHLWRGIHDPEITQRALTVELRVDDVSGNTQAVAIVRNAGAGHYFPTYIVPEIELILESIQSTGARRQIARALIARQTDIELAWEFGDTRLAPGEEIRLQGPTGSKPGAQLVLRMRVAPGAHYERLYAHMLKRRATLPPAAVTLLEQAAARAHSQRYEVVLARRPLY